MTRTARSFPIRLHGLAAVAAMVLGAGVLAAAPPALAQAVTPVKVERVKPAQEKAPTLRFLKENIDFIRARYDRLHQTPVAAKGGALVFGKG